MKKLVFLLALMVFCLSFGVANAAEIAGLITIDTTFNDGDTITVTGTGASVYGVDNNGGNITLTVNNDGRINFFVKNTINSGENSFFGVFGISNSGNGAGKGTVTVGNIGSMDISITGGATHILSAKGIENNDVKAGKGTVTVGNIGSMNVSATGGNVSAIGISNSYSNGTVSVGNIGSMDISATGGQAFIYLQMVLRLQRQLELEFMT